MQYLTGDLTIPNEHKPITRWNGLANPVPPGVRTGYWVKLYNRADTHIYSEIQRQVCAETGLPAHALKGKDKDPAAREIVLARHKKCRQDRTTWCFAVEYLFRDLVQIAEGDFPAGRAAAFRPRMEALLQTREK